MTLSFFEELDFDDTAETQPQEAAPSRRRPGRRLIPTRGSRGGGGGAGGGRGRPGRGRPQPQVQRLLVLVAAVVVVVVAAVFWIRSCQEAAQKRAYRNYVAKVNAVVAQSNRYGGQLDDVLASNTTSSAVLQRVRAITAGQRAVQTQAEQLSGTGRLRPLQPWLVAAMQYRTIGLQELERTLGKAFAAKSVTLQTAANVSRAYEDLLASDVVYSDSFATPGQQALTDAGVHDATIASSVFARTPSYVKPQDMRAALAAIASSRGTGPRGQVTCPKNAKVGTQLDGVSVETPGGLKSLSPTGVTPVTASSAGIKYVVTLSNAGDVRVSNIQIRFRELGRSTPVFPKLTRVKFLNPGQSAQRTFTAAQADFGHPEETIRVEIRPDPCETNPNNNAGSYKIQYQLR